MCRIQFIWKAPVPAGISASVGKVCLGPGHLACPSGSSRSESEMVIDILFLSGLYLVRKGRDESRPLTGHVIHDGPANAGSRPVARLCNYQTHPAGLPWRSRHRRWIALSGSEPHVSERVAYSRVGNVGKQSASSILPADSWGDGRSWNKRRAISIS